MTVPRYAPGQPPHPRRNGTGHRPPLSLRAPQGRGNPLLSGPTGAGRRNAPQGLRIATPSARNDMVIGGWSFCLDWAMIGPWSAGAVPPALRGRTIRPTGHKNVGNGHCPFRSIICDNRRPSGETGPGNHNRRHCEGREPRGNLLHHVSTTMAPINIVHPGFSMLISLSPHPTAAVEIATAFGLAMTEVDGGWSFCFG